VIGQQLGAYKILSELGTGGMGTVYLAEARAEGEERRRVALKVVHPYASASEGFFKRFLREAELGRKIVHDNVVRTLDLDAVLVDDKHVHFLVMEYVEGQTLRALREELERVPEELCRHIAREVGKGLAAIHAAGAVHRDLKPENVLVTWDHVVKIMDLGVARLREDDLKLTKTGGFLGTLQYAAPEQLFGEVSEPAADFYALGLILYELATGKPPFPVENLEQSVNDRLVREPRPASELNPQLSPFFEELLKALLQRDPAKRLDFVPEDEESAWWKARVEQIRAVTRRPLRRIRIPRETDLYGRDEELAQLRDLYDRMAAGHGRVVLIEGEAGIGKSRLADELIGRLEAEGEELNFLFGSYPPGGAATPAGAWSTAYREHYGAEQLDAALTDHLSRTPALVPAFAALLRGEPTPEASEPLTKDSLQTVFVHATRALAEERPTVIVIEDLHFAPQEGRALLAALAHAISEHRVLLIGTARPPLPDEWVSNLDRLEHVQRLPLERLGPKDLSRLLVDVFRSERLAEELAFRIAAKSDGNPFFVFEIIRGLREGRLIAKRPDGTWRSTQAIREIEIPSTVRELVQARIAGLGDDDRELLDVAACCGFEFDPLLVGEVLGRPEIPLLRRLGRLEHPHRIVRSVGLRYVFDHHQVQEALYASQSELLRRRYHASIGETLERRAGAAGKDPAELDGALATELCSHFLSGALGERALRYLEAALAHLGRSYLSEQGVTLADRALETEGLLEGARRVEILFEKATRLDRLGRWAQQLAVLEEAVDLARSVEDAELRSRAHRAMGWCLLCQGRYDEAREECTIALDLCRESGDRQGEAMATGNLGLILWSVARYEEAREHFERHLEISRAIGDRLTEAKGSGNLGLVFRDLGRDDESRKCAERHLAISREIGYRQGEANATGNLGVYLWNQGRHEEAREHYERQLAIVREIGDRRGEATSSGNLGLLLEDRGRFAEALERYEHHLAITHETGDLRNEAIAQVNLGGLLARLGDLEAAQERLAGSLAICREIGARFPEGYALHGMGIVAEAHGELDDARRLLEEALALRREIKQRTGIATTLLVLARVLVSAGRREEAGTLLDEAAELETSTALVQARALRATLDASEADAALAAFEEHATGMGPGLKMEIRFLLWEATGDRVHLDEAGALLDELRSRAPDEYRGSMVERVPLNRAISEALGGSAVDRPGRPR
jgi:tetratricopeptide (TPR) repeat protein